jgi:hypothetical protein
MERVSTMLVAVIRRHVSVHVYSDIFDLLAGLCTCQSLDT